MRTRIVMISTIVALAGVAILGSANAGAKPLRSTSTANAAIAGSTATASGSTVALKAVPFAGPVLNVAYSFSTATTGGTGQVFYAIPAVPRGVYEVSFTANFFPVGSPAAPITFACGIVNGTSATLYTMGTTASVTATGFYVGVNGAAFVRNPTSLGVQAFCGTADGSAWDFGTRPIQVTLTRLDGLSHGSLNPSPKKKGGAVIASR
jgi:hypothetical protein